MHQANRTYPSIKFSIHQGGAGSCQPISANNKRPAKSFCKEPLQPTKTIGLACKNLETGLRKLAGWRAKIYRLTWKNAGWLKIHSKNKIVSPMGTGHPCRQNLPTIVQRFYNKAEIINKQKTAGWPAENCRPACAGQLYCGHTNVIFSLFIYC